MSYELRPYQEKAKNAIESEWAKGVQKTLLVLATGCGKTIVFSKVIEEQVKNGSRVLILAHREELLNQASDKLYASTGLVTSLEKADSSCLDSFYRVTVGSIQSLQQEKRLNRFPKDYFDVIIIDEAHHALSDGYQRVLSYFEGAKVLGVTATPDRGDKKKLGEYFQSLAFEYNIAQAIREGYLCKVMAQTIPLSIDLNNVKMQSGDFAVGEVANALDPYLEQIAKEMELYCRGRKTVVFLPLIATSQKFCEILNRHGFCAAEVNGQSDDRKEVLRKFEEGKYDVLCNAMLLTEGYDCPDIDCIIVLRPTKVRSLYCQMVGRGTRLAPNKKHLLLLDFLWMTERHDLCRPADIICNKDEVKQRMTKNLAEDNNAIDIIEAEEVALKDVQFEREQALQAQLAEMKKRKRKLVDPLQYAFSINSEDLENYEPTFEWEMTPATDKQIAWLEQHGIFPDDVQNCGYATMLIEKLKLRQHEGLSTPKQIRFLEGKGFNKVGEWTFEQASNMISRYSLNEWRTPQGIIPAKYIPS